MTGPPHGVLKRRRAEAGTYDIGGWMPVIRVSDLLQAGPPGPAVELGANAGMVRWRVEGDQTWTDLAAQRDFGLCRFAKAGLMTAANGVWSGNLGAGRFSAPPSIAIQPRGDRLLHSYSISGTPADGYLVTVQFWQLRASLAVLGALTITITSPVTFDMQAFETTP